jgi:hypothetical protein
MQYFKDMKDYKKAVWQVIILSIWINLAETIRWIAFSKPYFVSHSQNMNIEQPSGPLYLIIWFVWGILVALLIYTISQKFSYLKATFIIWFSVFSGVWIMLINLKIVSFPILSAIAAFCFIEIFIGTLISKYFHKQFKH